MPLRIGGKLLSKPEERYGMDEWFSLMNGSLYDPLILQQTMMPGSNRETFANGYIGNAQRFGMNGPVFALMNFRLRLFSQVRWAYQQLRNGTPGDLFSLPSLDLLNTNAHLNVQMIQDVDLAGNSYTVLEPNRVCRLRPDWVQVVGDGPLEEYDTQVYGYAYYPGGPGNCPPDKATFFPAEYVAHWYPTPDPLAVWRGMSWLTPVIREVNADSAATIHKSTSFENGATPNMIIKYDPTTSFENFVKAKQAFSDEYEGAQNARKTLHLGGGADATVVGSSFKELDFKAVQGAGETRLAAAAGVHPVCVGFAEGMQGSSLNAGNFGMARRSTADGTFHPLWVSAAAALATILPPAGGARLFYDANDIPYLREDEADNADIKAKEASTIRQLIDAGFEPESVKKAVKAGDWALLVHSGLYSVQLQAPGSSTPVVSTPAVSTNGRSLSIVRDEHGFVSGVEVG